MFVVPELKEFQKPAMPGKIEPAATPKNITIKIHNVK
jgi:hypothetical protein